MSLDDELKEMLTEEDEDLSDDCMALPHDVEKLTAAKEREARVLSYFSLKNNAEALKATIAWNEKHLGSASKEKNKAYQDTLEKNEMEMRHQLRAVKLLDKHYPPERK